LRDARIADGRMIVAKMMQDIILAFISAGIGVAWLTLTILLVLVILNRREND